MARNNGFDDLSKQLKKMEKSIEKYESGQNVGFSELFNPTFMKKHTKFVNIDEFFEKSPFKVEIQSDFENIDEAELDAYVDEYSRFNTWEEMLGEAGQEHLAKELGF
jgi:hypothetical protein